ncbi:MAG: PaaX family transcriptional regulator C-terminal domain-containing protein [Pseudomonadota bacterium]
MHSGRRVAVWSLVITIFGDAVLPRGGTAAMADLQMLASKLGVSSGALRTAMSRLASDGWATREKQGRNSSYTLTEKAVGQSRDAAHVIYRSWMTTDEWVLAIDADGSEAPGSVAPGVRIVEKADPVVGRSSDCLVLSAEVRALPDWARAAICPPDWEAGLAALAEILEPMAANTDPLIDLEPENALAARVALIHIWRRLILRHPVLPKAVVGENWPGDRTLKALGVVYGALVHSSERFWETPTPSAGVREIEQRFGA